MEVQHHVLFSSTVGCKMKFGVYVPTQAEKEKVPLLIFLSGTLESFRK
jgi:predicted peptidase